MQGNAQEMNLRYIPAASVDTPAGGLARLSLHGPDGAELGTPDGILVDASTLQYRYLVVRDNKRGGQPLWLIPAEALIRLASDHGVTRLQVDASDEVRCALWQHYRPGPYYSPGPCHRPGPC